MKKLLTLLLLMAFAGILNANKIAINNLTINGKDVSAGADNAANFQMVQFDISWDNSWRTSTAESNWDAAWVFVKYRIAVSNGGDGLWHHASLNDAGHTAPSGTPAGSTVTPGLLDPYTAFNAATNPGLGAFIYRSADGNGTNTWTGAKLRWNYGANGISDANAGLAEIRVFAIEMVYVPQGSFYVGTGANPAEVSTFTAANNTSGASVPFQITSTAPTIQGNNAGSSSANLSARGALDLTGTTTANLATGFPTGYSAFYCMKYEISQQGYVDFLNSLSYAQQAARTANAPSSVAGTGALIEPNTSRNGIDIMTPGVSSTTPAVYACNLNGNTTYSEADDGQNIACNFLSTADVAAYFDWSGLRPMTELEFEKACRGTGTPLVNECAWGNASFPPDNAGSRYTLNNSGATAESIATNYATPPIGNVAYTGTNSNISGPLRVGIFAGTPGNTGRVSSGATYYGIMEMSGNLRERTIYVGNATGRLFTGTHGNGELTVAGLADALLWPVATGNGVRGGSIQGVAVTLQVSDRTNAGFNQTTRNFAYGGRGVRGMPFTCGAPFAISHVTSGGVAPVDKTVSYGTVTNIPGETSKCWITSNLGADHQATDVSDATEASAGWYWQFNRKQGYKHDGTTRTPSAWDATNDNLSSTWEVAKDPCAIELGSTWRIPTYTEWYNVDNTGGWGTWTGPWNSGLKLHAAGYLDGSDGSLNYRGSIGNYWSSTQYSTTYGWYLYFYSGYSSMNYNSKAYGFSLRCLRDLLPTLTTTDASIIEATTATSGGNITDQGGSAVTVRGVCWSTTTGPTVALATKTTDGSGTGAFTSAITGLTGSTLYYVRAYATNSEGTAYGNEVSFTTIAAFACGTSTITKNHVASGGVAPVDKTVTYGTVTNIPGETSKCWITSNLGADHQATDVSDATEASAGWYWQFNRKQGYQYTTSRTPGTAWDATNDNLSATWEAAKDPCALELGTGWRIPTNTEWTNVDGSSGGNWTNWNGPFGSALKLHAAGYLYSSGGSLNNRGSYGNYWSSTQYSTTNGWFLLFVSGYSYVSYGDKAYGFTLRCLRD